MKLSELYAESRLMELLSTQTDPTLAPGPGEPMDPNAPKVSPQAQMAQHQKELTARKKEIQDQITLLNKQIMDLKKQLSTIR